MNKYIQVAKDIFLSMTLVEKMEVAFILLAFGVVPLDYLSKREEVFTVKDKGTLTRGSDGDVYTHFMVYTTENKAYRNSNDIFYLKFHSAELQSQIEKGKTYQATISGWRVGMLDMYPNILNVKEIAPTKTR